VSAPSGPAGEIPEALAAGEPGTTEPGPEPSQRPQRLFEDGRIFHPDGRARFVVGEPRPPTERPNERFPFALLTGRGSAAQWHTQTRTAKSAVLRHLAPQHTYVEVSPGDAARLQLCTGEAVEVSSPRGSMRAHVAVTTSVQEGHLFVSMHDPAVNGLTHPSFDPSSRQPSYKHAAAALRRVEHWER
jgi:anaerobic selenocysteine-containing dehydrogenase